jgi:hypothetical protein
MLNHPKLGTFPVKVVGAALDQASIPASKVALDKPTLLVLGNEGRGYHQQPVAAFNHFGYYPDPREIPRDLLDFAENYYSTRIRYKMRRVAGGKHRSPGVLFDFP